MKGINIYLRNQRFIPSLAILFVVYLALDAILTFVFKVKLVEYDIIFHETPMEAHAKEPIWRTILQVIVLAPLLETLLIQKGLYHLLSLFRWFRRHRAWIVVVGAVVFGALHFYTLFYIIVMMLYGALFMYAYVIKRYKHGYWFVVILHALANTWVLLVA